MIFYCPKGSSNWKRLFSFCWIIAIVIYFAEYKFIAYSKFKRIEIALQGVIRFDKKYNIVNIHHNGIEMEKRFSNI